jgi:putative ABC transport system permease protein
MKRTAMLNQAARALITNKKKMILMSLGPAIGVAALTVVIGIVEGSGRKMGQRVRSFGTAAINLVAGDNMPPPDMDVTTLTLADARAVKREIKGIRMIAPALQRRGMNLEHGANYTTAAVFGVTETWQPSWNWKVARGRNIQKKDLTRKSRVCAVGHTVKKALFGAADPLGKTLRVGKINFTVVGVLARRGSSPCGSDMDNRIIIPLTTMMRRVANVDHIAMVRIVVADRTRIKAVTRQVRALMRKRHRIKPPDEDDFGIITPKVIGKLAGSVGQTLRILLWIVAAVCLLGGGVVVMNIMLMAVSERQSEIGIRRAVGATRRDIRGQFMIEAALVTSLGGLVGIFWGVFILLWLRSQTETQAVLSWIPLVVGFVSAATIGIVFGVLPAQRAANLQPVEALRE